MDAFGCQIISKLSADSAEGFSSTVACDGEMRGPFLSILEAVECAKAWSTEIRHPGIPDNSAIPPVTIPNETPDKSTEPADNAPKNEGSVQ